ncbi:hypothetical protein FACS189452_03830 [Bacteroidia bacterium]|nr:hypothetical protein FACS189452_03830 [Bacteroidia bacterium]
MADGSPPSSGTGWTYSGNVYTIQNGANVTVTGTNASQRRLAVAANATATITLNGVSITGLGDDQSALLLNSGANVTLVLADGTTNTLTAGGYDAGIRAQSGTTLTIEGDTGILTATGTVAGDGISGAGIGGKTDVSAGTITINGGTVTATGGWGGAGIGGGAKYSAPGNGGYVTINGGTVTAISGGYAADIGGGFQNTSDGTLTINGGSVKTPNNNIPPQPKNSASVNVYLTTLTVGSGTTVDDAAIAAAAISTTPYGVNGVKTDANGLLYFWLPANVSTSVDVAVGSPLTKYSNASFEVKNDNTTAETLTANGTATLYSATYNANGATGDVPTAAVEYLSGTSVRVLGNAGGLTKTGYAFGGWTIAGNGLSGVKQAAEIFTMPTSAVTLTAIWHPKSANATIDMGDPDPQASGTGWTYSGNVYTIQNGANVTVTGSNSGSERRIAVAANAAANITLNGVTITGLSTSSPLLLNNGANVTLNLADGTTNTLTAGGNCAGIQAPDGTTLLIEGSTGILNATGSLNSAGIGGGLLETGGHITINGGTVTAKSGTDDWSNTGYGGAGIGGGASSDASYDPAGAGGTIVINGGIVTATGGYCRYGGAGIGSGGSNYMITGSAGGNITINGGTITATGRSYSAGIGGGNKGEGGNITINGGSVIATGASSGTGIGGGNYAAGGNITINGGTITATSTSGDGAGIGGAQGAAGGTIVITGGIVTAGAVTDVNCIGYGYGYIDTSGTVTITGGSVNCVSATKILPQPTNGSANVYLNKLYNTTNLANEFITDIYGVTYGLTDVKADANGNLYFWLPASAASEVVAVSKDNGTNFYGADYQRETNNNKQQELDLSLTREATPSAGFDYASEKLTGLTPSANYTVDGADKATDGSGEIAIDETWFGNAALQIVKKGNNSTTINSLAQNLSIFARPTAPSSLVGVDETIQGQSDGKITGTDATMEYANSTTPTTWTACTTSPMTGFAPGTYYVRYKAVASTSFASTAATVTIAVGAPPTYTLSVTPPTFTAVQQGYTPQPAAAAITITSSGNSDATIASVAPTAGETTAFTIGGSGTTVTAGGNITTWTVQPASGLGVGTHTAIITVTYNGTTAEAEVSFTVNQADLSGSVTIDGNAVFGATLTANTGSLTTTPTGVAQGTLTYEWKRGGTTIGTNSATYTLVGDDIGSTITVTVTAANCAGSVTSNPTSAVGKASSGLTASSLPVYLVIGTSGSGLTVDLSGIALSTADHGAVAYSLGAFTTNNGVVSTAPTLNTDGHTLQYGYDATASSTGHTSTQAITITTANYADISADVVFEVTSKTSVTISGVSVSPKTYDGNAIAASGSPSVSGGTAGLPLIWLYTGTGGTSYSNAAPPTNAGAYNLNISTDPADLVSGYVDIPFTINKATLTVTADSKSKTYGDANPTLTVAYSSFVNGEDADDLTTKPTASTTANASSAVGTYTITAAGGVSNNYAFTYVDGTLTINKATLTVTAVDTARLYGESNPTFRITYAGWKNGEGVSVLSTAPTATTTATTDSAVGTYTITVAGGNAGNYAFTYVDGTLTVNKAAAPVITFPTTATTITYGEALSTATLSGGTAGYGDFDWTTPATVPTVTNSGYEVTFTPSASTVDNYNTITPTTATVALTVSKATLTVTPNAGQSKVVGTPDPAAYTYDTDGWKGSDGASLLTGALIRTAGDTVGTYAITQGTLADTSGNYTITFTAGVTFAITPVTSDNTNVSTVAVSNATLPTGAPNFYLADCGTTLVQITVTPEESTSQVLYEGTAGSTFSIDVTRADIHEVTYTVQSTDGSEQTHTLQIESRFAFGNITGMKFDNVLYVNNNPKNNGGYKFTHYEWYRNGQPIGNEQVYSAGDNRTDRLDPTADYSVTVTTESINGIAIEKTLQVCPGRVTLESTSPPLKAYPNPVQSGATITLESIATDGSPIRIYSITGGLIDDTKQLHNGKAQLTAPQATGIYLITVDGEMAKVVVKQ